MKKPKYLYHGSSIKCTVLHPNQAYDWGFDAGNKFAVYATSSKHIASLFALGCSSKHSDEPCHRILDYKYGTPLQMLYWKGHTNKGGTGYIYKVSSEGFIHAGGTQWINPQSVIPLDIEEFEIDQHTHLYRYPTALELLEIEKEYLQSVACKAK